MRRGLRWTLAGTLLASAAALWWNPSPQQIAPALVQAVQRADAERAAVGAPQAEPGPGAPLPETLPALELEPAARDLFATFVAPVVPVRAVPQAAPVPPLPPPPPAPVAPPLNLRFLGSMVSPAGERTLYLARGEAAVAVVAGQRLEEGFVVQSIEPQAVLLQHPATGTQVSLPIPAAPQPGSRP